LPGSMSNPFPYSIPQRQQTWSPLKKISLTQAQVAQILAVSVCAVYLIYPRLFTEAIECVDTMIWRASEWWNAPKDEDIAMKVAPKIKRRAKASTKESSGMRPRPNPLTKVHFPGMVNLSGTLCYMNSVLQVSGSYDISDERQCPHYQAS
jgi:hypothetical protein